VSPGLFQTWRAERRLRRQAAEYVRGLLADPAETDVEWLSEAATSSDLDRARWELRYARRALGLISAQRDALDDRTGSLVASALGEAMGGDPNVAAGMTQVVERQFNTRLRNYADAFGRRSSPDGLGRRLGRALLAASGNVRPSEEDLARGAEVATKCLEDANSALRRIYGTAALPEHLPPSEALGSAAATRRDR
jgi:hypothetical protein